MAYFSHCEIMEDGTRRGSKYLKSHIAGVGSKYRTRLYRGTNFEHSPSSLEEWLNTLVTFHDLGKYTDYFQKYLFGHNVDQDLKNHAFIGAIAAFQKLFDEDAKLAYLAYFLIRKHHGNLIRPLGDQFLNDEGEWIRYQDIFAQQSENLLQKAETINQELQEQVDSLLQFPKDERELRKQAKQLSKKKTSIENFFFINYCFSLLLEGDKLDASDTEVYQQSNIPPTVVDDFLGKPGLKDLTGFGDLSGLNQEQLRDFSRAQVLSNLNDSGILDQKLFTLTAPTGIGKTLTSLDFAIRLKNLIQENKGYEAQIIYALPFINIIEQNLNVYQEVFKGDEEPKILAHYQYADVFNDGKETLDEKAYNQRLMTLDTWQSDIVITSFVQLFESIITNKNRLLKKFNHLAGSIVILDEVQTLKLEIMPLFGAVLYYLTKFLDVHVILMTATKPKIFELANSELLSYEDEKAEPKELLTDYETIFQQFRRTQLIPLLNEEYDPDNLEADFVNQVFTAHWQSDQSCLIVCNKVNRAIEIYKAVQKLLENRKQDNPVFHLSTNILPKHRKARIQKIHESIENREAPIVIATQVVEAGVDLDFDIGFRDLGPIDSVIQVAGRINRNNHPDKEHAPLYITDFGDCTNIYGTLTKNQAQEAIQKESIQEEDYLKALETYYEGVSGGKNFELSEGIFKSMKTLNYDDNQESEYPINSFRLINNSSIMRSVFIEYDEEAEDCKNNYQALLNQDIKKSYFDKNYKKAFNQHIITVPFYFCEDLLPIHSASEEILLLPKSSINKRYNTKTGYIRDKEIIQKDQLSTVML